MDYQVILEEIAEEVQPFFGKGRVADYIPALAGVAPGKFGMAVHTVQGETFHWGDAAEPFSIQSISKLFTLTMAMRFIDDKIWERVGKEPSGNPFNSLVQLEYEQGIPRNPLINAGAMVITDYVISHTSDTRAAILSFVQYLAGSDGAAYDEQVARSEKETGHRNAALAHFLKSYGRLDNPVDTVLDVYFHQCSLTLSCQGLARAFLFLANQGIFPQSKARIITPRQTKRINAVMLTCGMYDAVGDFAFWVGLPGKSGVGGGIVAVDPGELCLAVWSPELNASGNSLVGAKALELFTTKTGRSIF